MNGIHLPPRPNADLYTDTALIRNYVENLIKSRQEVVVLMHSYGGQVGTDALVGLGAETRRQEGRPGGVIRLIYIVGFALTENTSMIEVVKSFGHEESIPIAFDFAQDDSCVDCDPKTLLVGPAPGLEEKKVDAYVAGLERWNGKCMYQGIHQCVWREIPVSYVYTTTDMTVP